MTTSLILLITMGVLIACGVFLMLDRSLTRVLMGFVIFGNGVNMLIMLTAGPPGLPPLTDGENLSTDGMNDPLPQALILTAIVITFALTAFLLALIYRSWRLVRAETIDDDLEDLRVGRDGGRSHASEAGLSESHDDTEFGDEAETPVPGAVDLDDDGTPREREAHGTSTAEPGGEDDSPQGGSQ